MSAANSPPLSPSHSISLFTQLTEKSGEFYSSKLLTKLIGPVAELGFEDVEASCKKALQLYGDLDSLKKHEASKRSSSKPEKRSYDIFSKINSVSKAQIKNHSLRFMTPEATEMSPRLSFMKFGLNSGRESESRDYEDVVSAEILNAPICDLCIIQSGEPVPDGFYRIYKTPGNRKASLNTGSGGNPIYMCIKKDVSGKAPAITSLIIIFPDRNENVPQGYSMVMRGKNACNINTGTSAERIYICYKKFAFGSPLIDVQPLFLSKGEEVPKSFNLLDKSPSGLMANLNYGTSGVDIFLSYKQNLLRLEYLLNDFSAPVAVTNKPTSRMTRQASMEDVLSANQTSPAFHSQQATYEEIESRERDIQMLRDVSQKSSMSSIPSTFSGFEEAVTDSLPTASAQGHHPVASRDYDINTQKNDELSEVLHTFNESISIPPSLPDDFESSSVASSRKEALNPLPFSSQEPAMTPSSGVSGTGQIPSEEELVNGDDLLPDVQATEECNYNNRRGIEVVDSNGKISPEKSRRSLYAVLSAVYIRHGNVASIAIAGLSQLLKDTDFFENDLKNVQMPGTITMIDLTIEAVCDRFDYALDAENESLLQFVRILIKHSGARLSPISLQRMHRAISFVCNTHSTRRDWITAGLSMPCNDPLEDLSPFKVLKQLIWDIVAHVESVDVAYYLPLPTLEEYHDDGYTDVTVGSTAYVSESYLEVRFIVEDFIDDVIDSVETSRISELSLQFISKPSSLATSGFFWQTIDSFATKLFNNFQHRSAYVILCATCKTAWNAIRTTSSGDPIPRDLGTKLIALEAITEFCLCAGEKMRQSKIMGYQIRRLVIPCVVFNTVYALVDHRVFAKLMKIISALWKKWRHCIRIEFAIICEQLIIKVLQASVVQIRPIFQMIVMQEVVSWFDQPHLLVEMFVNYDMDRKFVSHWNVFSYLVRTICAIGRRLTVVTRAWEWKAAGVNSAPDEANKVAVTIRDVHLDALDEVVRIAKTLMDASGHAHLILLDETHRMKSLKTGGGWTEDEGSGRDSLISVNEEDTSAVAAQIQPPPPPLLAHTHASGNSFAQSHRGSVVGSVKLRKQAHLESEDLMNNAIKIFAEKKSLKKAIDFLINKNFMNDTPQEIVNFLRVYKNNFDPISIGEFLGEGGITPAQIEYWSQIRFRYTRAVSFVEMELEPALRLYLTGCGFRLPGEAQKIDRFVEVFVKTFWQDNSGTPCSPFRQQLTVHLLAYAIIMLNTDLHRANSSEGRGGKKRKKMTKDEFVNNLRGIDQNHDVDRDYLVRIYESIESKPIEMAVQTAAEADAAQANINKKLAANDLAANRLGLSGSNGNLSSTGGQNNNKPITNEMRIAEEKLFVTDVCRSLRDSDDLLRSLACFTYRFQLTGVDTKISLDLVTYMYETVWFHFHAIVESLLTADNMDTRVQFSALDILCYSLTSAIFLNMKIESMTFARLLRQYSEQCWRNKCATTADQSNAGGVHNAGSIGSNSSNNNPKTYLDDKWFTEVEKANSETSMETTALVHKLVVQIKDAIQETTNRELTQQVAAKFEKKIKVLDTNTFFVKQGDLTKLNRANRPVVYRFFLFSDELIYAHLGMKNEYKVNKQMSLSAMSVSDVDNDPTFCSFFISHPIKSFVVVAESPVSKQHWLRDIHQTIESCKKREMNRTTVLNRRMSMYGRIEGQVAIQTSETAITASPDSRSKQKALRRLQHTGHLDDLVNRPDPNNGVKSISTAERSQNNDAEDLGQVSGGSGDRSENDSNEDIGNVDKLSSHIFSTDDYSESTSPDIASTSMLGNDQVNSNNHSAHGDQGEGSSSSLSEKTNYPSLEERAKQQQEAILTFTTLVKTLPEKSLVSLLQAGLTFWKGSLASRGGGSGISDDIKLRLTLLQKKLKSDSAISSSSSVSLLPIEPHQFHEESNNSHSVSDESGSSVVQSNNLGKLELTTAQVLILQSVNDLSMEEARNEFLCTLFAAFPYWKYDNFL